MAEGVANRPWPADQRAHALLAAEPLEANFVERVQRLIVPADGSPHLTAVAVDTAGRVVRRRDTAGHPVMQPAEVAQASRHGTHAAASLPLEPGEIQLA